MVWEAKNCDEFEDLLPAFLGSQPTDYHLDQLLHVAARHGAIDGLTQLERSGADLLALNGQGKTALEVAKEVKQTEVVEYLKPIVGPGLDTISGFWHQVQKLIVHPRIDHRGSLSAVEHQCQLLDVLMKRIPAGSDPAVLDAVLRAATDLNAKPVLQAVLKNMPLDPHTCSECWANAVEFGKKASIEYFSERLGDGNVIYGSLKRLSALQDGGLLRRFVKSSGFDAADIKIQARALLKEVGLSRHQQEQLKALLL